MLKEAEI